MDWLTGMRALARVDEADGISRAAAGGAA